MLSDDIDQSSINQKGSFNMFKDKFVDSSGIDFSDRIKPNSGRAGYQSKTVYEMIGEQVAKVGEGWWERIGGRGRGG